jgi:hypothetical protein
MKKVLMVSLFALVTIVSFGQNKITSSLNQELKDGLDNPQKITFKVYGPEKFDSLWGNKSKTIIEKVIYLTNLELMYSMKNRESYKPIQTPKNTIMYFPYKDETNIVVTLVVEAKNGYGNTLTKEYHCYAKGDFLSDNLYNTVKVDISSY